MIDKSIAIRYMLRKVYVIQVECNTLAPFLVFVLSRTTPYTHGDSLLWIPGCLSVCFNFITGGKGYDSVKAIEKKEREKKKKIWEMKAKTQSTSYTDPTTLCV